MSMNNYSLEVTLPTMGLLNPEIPEGKVILRCMMASDKKFLAGTSADGDTIVRELLNRCVTSPEGFDSGKLIPQDLMFLLFKLRILSYGENYTFRTKCSECGKHITANIKLSDLIVHDLPADYEKSLSVVLPNAGDTIYTKFLTNDALDDVRNEARRMKRKFSSLEGDPEVTLRIAAMIEKIDLKEVNAAGDKELTNNVDILKYVEGLTDYDCIAMDLS